MNRLSNYLKRKGLKTRDIAIDPVSATIGGTVLGTSIWSWALIALVCAGVIFAIVKIVQISKKKRTAQA